MTKPFPMLAAKADESKLKFPLYGSPKLDGIRAVIHNKQALSRKLIALPNRHIQEFFAQPHLQGLDGELIVGEPTDPLCIKHTTSGVMSRDGEPSFTFHVFDKWNSPGAFFERLGAVLEHSTRAMDVRILAHTHVMLHDLGELLVFEAEQLAKGYEGIILRAPDGLYKHGRSTVKEGGMLKVKRFEDSECGITNVVEEMHNSNEAGRDNLGRTKRSSAKAGKSGKGRAGVLVGYDPKYDWPVELGTGMDDADKAEWWEWWCNPNRVPRLAKYKFFPIGVQDRPRHPVYKSWRSPIDT